jgi:hypothetical protein
MIYSEERWPQIENSSRLYANSCVVPGRFPRGLSSGDCGCTTGSEGQNKEGTAIEIKAVVEYRGIEVRQTHASRKEAL